MQAALNRTFKLTDKRYSRLKKAAQIFFDEYRGKTTDYLERAIDEQIDRDIKSGKLPLNFKDISK